MSLFGNLPKKWRSGAIATFEGAVVDPGYARPLFQCVRDSFMSDVNAVATVVLLIGPAGPNAVSSFVIAVGVDAFQRVSIWLRSHICKEIRERIYPAQSHRYAAATIASIANAFRIKTAFFGCTP